MIGVMIIALEHQVHLYAVDTKAFYTDTEMALDREIEALRGRKRQIKKILSLNKSYKAGQLTEAKFKRRLQDLRSGFEGIPTQDDIDSLSSESAGLTPIINQLKSNMIDLLNQFDGVRVFRDEYIREKNIISLFESTLSRTLNIPTGGLTTDLIVVKTCYFKILSDLIHNGFLFNGEKYIFFTASAGQIRTKRSVFIREACFIQHCNTLMCSLSVDSINAHGGINPNKLMAYLALCNSATDPWVGFDIRKTIVVDDMETCVSGLVDFIDEHTYNIERKHMDIPIEHTDGAGMVRLDISRKNFMCRLPWIKGLLAAFPFDKFIREANRADPKTNHGLITDIYGVQHDVLAEDIQVIFTKSQFKMAAYYNSWDEYCTYFEEYGCEAGICNMEPDVFENAKINYQMLQTLSDLTDDELMSITSETRRRLENISSDQATMLKVFGATKDNPKRNGFQESLMLYPELLQDEYTRDTLREIKKSIEKEACSGRVDIDGVFTFVIPDMYAFCQYLFLGDKNPTGLLADQEVYCNLFDANEELDCLRSPHLYIEHCVRKNVAGTQKEYKRWFVTHGIYVSCHDLISKVVMCDWDGDRLLVVGDQTIVSAAKRNTKDVVPLQYKLAKSGAQQITPTALYNSLIAAYTGGNIGQISNDITKIWNSGDITKDKIDAVKRLCYDNNQVIDFAKTLWKASPPDQVVQSIKQYTHSKVPHFFIYAKDKLPEQVEDYNNSPVNRIKTIVPIKRIDFHPNALGKFNPKMLMSSQLIPTSDISQKIIDTYQKYTHGVNGFHFDDTGHTDAYWRCQRLKEELLCVHSDIDYIVDVLVRYLFVQKRTKRKVMFWLCFGDVVAKHIRDNLGNKTSRCSICGKPFMKESNRQQMCHSCSMKQRKKMRVLQKRRARERAKNGGI